MIFDFILYFLLFFGFLMFLESLFNIVKIYWKEWTNE